MRGAQAFPGRLIPPTLLTCVRSICSTEHRVLCLSHRTVIYILQVCKWETSATNRRTHQFLGNYTQDRIPGTKPTWDGNGVFRLEWNFKRTLGDNSGYYMAVDQLSLHNHQASGVLGKPGALVGTAAISHWLHTCRTDQRSCISICRGGGSNP